MIHDGEKPKCGMSENVVDLQNDYSNGKDDDRDWWMWGYPIFRKKTHMSSLRTTRCPSLLAKFVTMTRQISRAYHIDISNISNSNYNYIIDACNMNQTNNAGGHHTVDLGWAI